MNPEPPLPEPTGYATATDRQAEALRREFEAYVTEQQIGAIRAGTYLRPPEHLRLEALEHFLLTKLAALQVRLGIEATP